jgi:hypothetical protein
MRGCHVEVITLIHCQTPTFEWDICSQNTVFIVNKKYLPTYPHMFSPFIMHSEYNADHSQ